MLSPPPWSMWLGIRCTFCACGYSINLFCYDEYKTYHKKKDLHVLFSVSWLESISQERVLKRKETVVSCTSFYLFFLPLNKNQLSNKDTKRNSKSPDCIQQWWEEKPLRARFTQSERWIGCWKNLHSPFWRLPQPITKRFLGVCHCHTCDAWRTDKEKPIGRVTGGKQFPAEYIQMKFILFNWGAR